MFLKEDEIILPIEDDQTEESETERLDVFEEMKNLIDLQEQWDTLSKNTMKLESTAIINKNQNLLEDGKLNWMKRAIDWFKKVFDNFIDFNIKIATHIKDFKQKSAPVVSSFVERPTNDVLSNVKVPRDIDKDLSKFNILLNYDITKEGTLSDDIKNMEEISDPRVRLSKNTGPLNSSLYDDLYKFSLRGRDEVLKKVKEVEKELRKLLIKSSQELKKLERNPEDFDVMLIDIYRNRMVNLQIYNTKLVRAMDYMTILAYHSCIEVAKETIQQQ